MTVASLLLMTTARLRDEKFENWDENSLLDLIRIAHNEVSKELQVYQKSISYTHDGSTNPLPLPRDMLSLIGVYIDEDSLDIKSYEWAMKHRNALSDMYAIINFDGLRINPAPVAGTLIEVVYKFTQPIYTKEQVIDLPELAISALLFYTLYLANQRETRKDSIERSNYYLGLYSAEIIKVKKDYLGFKNSRNIYPQYVKV